MGTEQLTINHPNDASENILARLIDDKGLAASGFYWALTEYLSTHGGSMPLEELPAFADVYGVADDWAKSIVCDYNLFANAELLFTDKIVLWSVSNADKPIEKKVIKKVDFETVKNLFNKTCTSYPKVIASSDTRRNKVRSRLVEMTQLGNPLEVFETIFQKMEASSVMKGKNKIGWKANFDWVIENGANWVKVYEGKFDAPFGNEGNGKDVNSYWDR